MPNLSEGRDTAAVRAFADALAGDCRPRPSSTDSTSHPVRTPPQSLTLAGAGVYLLDVSADADHHRSVLTAAGEPEALVRGLLAMARVAVDRIDLRRHQGVHPRVGAIDVVPFVPLARAMMEDAVSAAHRFGRVLAETLAIPVFLYGEAASDPARRPPAALRRHGLAAVEAALAAGSLVPDYGPSRAHPSAGVTLVGARGFLVAFNVRLKTADVRVARAIARAVRERDGGLAGVQALGLWLESRGQAQVSLNLLRPDVTPLPVAVERVRAEAAARGVEVDAGELIGLLPEAVARSTSASALFLPELGDRHILERRLAAALGP